MCWCDSGADTRDSENTFPANLADERNEEGRHIEREKEKKADRTFEVNGEEMK